MAHEKFSIKINAVYLDKNVISFSPKARDVDCDASRFPYFYDDCYVVTLQEPARKSSPHALALALGKDESLPPLFKK